MFFGQAEYKVKDIHESYLSALSLVKQNRIYPFYHLFGSILAFCGKAVASPDEDYFIFDYFTFQNDLQVLGENGTY